MLGTGESASSSSESITPPPNRSASWSRVLMLCSRRIFCQSLIAALLPARARAVGGRHAVSRRWDGLEPLGEDDPVVRWGVKVADARRLCVFARPVEGARRPVLRAPRRFYDEKPPALVAQP